MRAQADRAAALAEQLPVSSELAAPDLLTAPLLQLIQHPGARSVIERHAPDLVGTELVTASTALSLLDLARHAAIPASLLRALDRDLAALVD